MKLVFVDCCISQRGEQSRTHRLAEAYLKAYLNHHPEAEMETVSPEELLALPPFDVEEAMEAMGEVTGATVREDITARIFERFCVGK